MQIRQKGAESIHKSWDQGRIRAVLSLIKSYTFEEKKYFKSGILQDILNHTKKHYIG